MLCGLVSKGPVVYGFAWLHNIELGSRLIKPKNGYAAMIGICIMRCVMLHHWNPTKKEIEVWLDRKIHEFMSQENRNPQLMKEQWLYRYMYTTIHEIFFSSFLVELYEWIMKLADV